PDARDFLLGNGCPAVACKSERGASAWRFVQTAYETRGYALAWFREGEMTPAGRTVARLLSEAGRDGLDPARYDPRQLIAPLPMAAASALPVSVATPDPRVVLDVGLT